MTTIAPTHVRPTTLDGLLVEMEERYLADPEATLELDWSGIARLEGESGAILAAALLGRLGPAPLRVKVNPAGRGQHWLVRSGLAFAIANRSGDTWIEGIATEELAPWKRSWTPGTAATWRELFGHPAEATLFGPEAVGESPFAPDCFGPYYAAFINPHRQGASIGRDTAVARVVWPWLDRLLPQRRASRLRPSRRDHFIEDVGFLIDELLSNVVEHGTALGFGPSIHSLVQVHVTRGGSGSFDRLYLSVWDTGAGILRTVRPKLAQSDQDLSDQLLLTRLFDGQLVGWSRARATGLSDVARICSRQPGATLSVATGPMRVAVAGRRRLSQTRGAGFSLQGTLVTAVLPVRR